MKSKAHEILHKYWGYTHFRAPQEAIIEALLDDKQVVAVLPTGAGKSLCYQVPAMALPGLCIVVSPLIALMKDQVDGLKNRGIRALSLSAMESQDELVQQFDNLKYGQYKFLYLSPERLQSELVQEQLRTLSVSLIAVDEAHCISEWGHDFRPSYRKISQLRALHPKAKVIATTATATRLVMQDILSNLELSNSVQFIESLHRPELSFGVKRADNIQIELKTLLKSFGSPAIVYTSSRKACQTLSNDLNRHNMAATFYHGGLDSSQRQEAYDHWLQEITPHMVATNAFGMGIDKENVRCIVHAQLPFSLENYLQESGRAGRDGSSAASYIVYNDASIRNFKAQTDTSIIEIDDLKKLYKKLSHYFQVAPGERPSESYHFNLSDFCDRYALNQAPIFHSLRVLEQEGVIQLSENSLRKSTIKVTCSQDQLFLYMDRNSEQKSLINHLLRTYGGLFDHHIGIDEQGIASRTGLTKEQVRTRLQQMANDQIIEYKPILGRQSLLFLVPREDDSTINRMAKHIKQRNRIKLYKQKAVIEYIKNTKICRTKLLLEYFDQSLDQDCGHCDICRAHSSLVQQEDYSLVAKRILSELRDSSLSSNDLLDRLNTDKKLLLECLQILLEKNKISLTSQNKFQAN